MANVYRTFAHGTSREYAEAIIAAGLNEAAARRASRGGTASRPGAFHTYEIGLPEHPGPGFQMSYEFGLRHSYRPVIIVGRVSSSVIRQLITQEQILIQPTPDGGDYPDVPSQTVFLPETFPLLNREMQWQIVEMYHHR